MAIDGPGDGRPAGRSAAGVRGPAAPAKDRKGRVSWLARGGRQAGEETRPARLRKTTGFRSDQAMERPRKAEPVTRSGGPSALRSARRRTDSTIDAHAHLWRLIPMSASEKQRAGDARSPDALSGHSQRLNQAPARIASSFSTPRLADDPAPRRFSPWRVARPLTWSSSRRGRSGVMRSRANAIHSQPGRLGRTS